MATRSPRRSPRAGRTCCFLLNLHLSVSIQAHAIGPALCAPCAKRDAASVTCGVQRILVTDFAARPVSRDRILDWRHRDECDVACVMNVKYRFHPVTRSLFEPVAAKAMKYEEESENDTW